AGSTDESRSRRKSVVRSGRHVGDDGVDNLIGVRDHHQVALARPVGRAAAGNRGGDDAPELWWHSDIRFTMPQVDWRLDLVEPEAPGTGIEEQIPGDAA